MNKDAIMMNIPHKLKFIKSKYIQIRKKEVILSAMNRTNNTYYHIGFCINDCNTDNKF